MSSADSCVLFDPNESGAADAFNMAYAKFKNKLQVACEMSTNMAELKQSLGMMEKRLLQLVRFTLAVKRGQFDRAARILGLSTTPTGLRKGAKTLSDTWLEFHFGWSPLISDIGEFVKVFQQPIPKLRVKAVGSGYNHFISYSGANTYISQFATRCQLLADFWISNPNLNLADQLGFVNPASVAWELVPFSFVVDWFVNVGDIIASATDFAGVTFEQPTTTYLSDIHWTHQVSYGYWDKSVSPWVYRTGTAYDSLRRVTMQRSYGIGTPYLKLRPPAPWPWKRVVTAAALLVQNLQDPKLGGRVI
jgi:hypothetical protein